MSNTSRTGDATGPNNTLSTQDHSNHGNPDSVEVEAAGTTTDQVTNIDSSPSQRQLPCGAPGSGGNLNDTKDECQSNDDSTNKSGDADVTLRANKEGEPGLHINITSEVVSALANIEGVGNELKTVFKDVHTEIISAVSGMRNELSNVLTNAQFKVGASGPECGDSGNNNKTQAEDSVVDSSKDTGVRESTASGECGLQKVDPPAADSKSIFKTETSTGSVGDVSDSPRQGGKESQASSAATAPDLNIRLINADAKFECSVETSSVHKYSSLHESSCKELGRHIAIAEEVTEDSFKDDKAVEEEVVTSRKEKDNNFEGNKVFCLETRREYNGREESMKLLSSDNSEVMCGTRTVSAPSTPVPSSCKAIRKSMRSQGCRGRRVSFPEDETHLISSYLEPVNPWQQMGGTNVEEIANAYRSSCDRHCTQPLPGILHQIKALPLVLGGRVECLSLRGQRLDGSQCEGLEEIFRRVQFKILDLEGCYLDDDTAIPLLDMIEFYDSATQLNISCNEKIGFRGWQACSRMLKKTPSVEYLDAHNTNLNETNMPILGRALRLGARLHTLHLENCNLTGRPLIMLAAALRQNDTLKELYLAENRLGVNDCIQLGNLVRANSTLLLLDLRNNNVQDAGCGHVCEGITEQQKLQQKNAEDGNEKPVCKGLKSLVLWNNHLTQQSTSHLAIMLGVTRALETLNLGRNNLTSEGILRLKESLLRNRALLRLGLQAARVGDEGAVALAEYAADNTTIQHMDLRDNPIRVAGLMALAHSLRLNSTIIQLDIDSDSKSEPAAELAEQHASLQKEIKEICQRNLTQSHLKAADQLTVASKDSSVIKSAKEGSSTKMALRKISLTCETTTSRILDRTESGSREEEKQKYISPAPSPIPSPSPSPSPSPCASPVPSPLKNRFRVFKVSESSKSSPNLLGGGSQTNILCNVVPVSHSGRSLSAGDLSQPPKSRPNRFSVGGRFTVTRVSEPCSLPQDKVSTMATLSTNSAAGSGPKIVISSPVRVERGFSVDDATSKVGLDKNEVFKGELNSPVNLKSVDLPEDQIHSDRFRLMSDGDNDVFIDGANPKTGLSDCQRQDISSNRSLNVYKSSGSESQKSERDSDSVSSSDLTDSGFLDESSCGRSSESLSPSLSSPHPEGDRDSLLSSSVDSTNQEDSGLDPPMSGSLPSIPLLQQFDLHEPPKRAPLAAMENGSFDSDSEDSEVTTQSSDSTHSDEVRITAEQYQPKPAWGAKPEQTNLTANPEPLTSGSSGSG